MIDLVKHIETLLLENDCVIVPGLGGFIAHYHTATFNKEKNEFNPPYRSIGFNPRLTINDGLLAQSYMQAYNTDFSDATRKIANSVERLKKELYEQSKVELSNIGTLYYNINGIYEFEPKKDGFFTPSVYGLGTYTFPKLKPLTSKVAIPQTRKIRIHPNSYNRWIRNAAGIAAAIILFFLFSTPIGITYIDDISYASLGTSNLFDAIRDQSAATRVVQPTGHKQTVKSVSGQQHVKKQVLAKETIAKNNVNTLKSIAVKTEKVAPPKSEPKKVRPHTEKATPETIQPAPATVRKDKGSFIIVASLTTAKDAQNEVKKYQKQGYKDAQMLESKGRFRVALYQFETKADAYIKVQELKKNPIFSTAWVFTSK